MKRKKMKNFIKLIMTLALCICFIVPILASASSTYEIFAGENYFDCRYGKPDFAFMSITNFKAEIKDNNFIYEYDYEREPSIIEDVEVRIIYADAPATLTLLIDAGFSGQARGSIGNSIYKANLPDDKILKHEIIGNELPRTTGTSGYNATWDYVLFAGATFVLEEGTYFIDSGIGLSPNDPIIFVVVGDPTHKTGDINGDDKINIADLIRLSQHFAGTKDKEITDLDVLKLADVNGDGDVDMADLVRLAQYIAEIDLTPLGTK